MSTNHNGAKLDRPEIAQIVISSLEDVLAMSDSAPSEPVVLGEETRLIGRRGVLDSMGLVSLIIDVEQRLEEEHDLVLILADERAMSQERSPFRSVGAFADYIWQLVEEQG